MNKIFIFSAPSGSGKSTLIQHLIEKGFPLAFSISATSRSPRGEEQDGKDYYFLSPDQFRNKIKNGEFLEYEEVYNNVFYGTLKSEVDRIMQSDKNLVLDIDVQGALNVKKVYGDQALSIFVMPPSVEELESRLVKRGSDTLESIKSRIEKAKHEIAFAKDFDIVLRNENLELSKSLIESIVSTFIDF